MKYDEIIAGLRSLQAADFDWNDVDASGRERLAELTDALMSVDNPEKFIPELFSVMERLPDSDLGSPGPLVHTLERLHGYENELVRSITRCPSVLSVWMVNRILNADLPDDVRRSYMVVLEKAATHRSALQSVREDARDFIEFQMRKTSPDFRL
jgi:hypothetical protein